jgi:hypothetical protein
MLASKDDRAGGRKQQARTGGIQANLDRARNISTLRPNAWKQDRLRRATLTDFRELSGPG